MTNIFFIIFLIAIFLILFNTNSNHKDNFAKCQNTPTGPYSTSCSLINFNSNVLTAYCPNNSNDKKLVFSRLDMNDCNDSGDSSDSSDSGNCDNIRVSNDGSLIC